MNTDMEKTDLASLERLTHVHADLRKLFMHVAQGELKFSVTEGLRTLDRQKQLLKAGASRTLNSRHLTGHALDVACWVDLDLDGKLELRWDQPLYAKFSWEVKAVARSVGIPIEWGGDWTSFKDGPHFQLPWKEYPADGTDVG